MTNENLHIGSSFDDFLKEEKIAERVEDAYIKKAIALGLRQFMQKNNISKTALAERMHTSRSQIDRLLDPQNDSVTLSTLREAATVMGKKLTVTLEPA